MDEKLRLKLLGPPAAFIGEEPLGGFVSVKAQALLFYLAATGEMHRRDALAALLWSDAPEAVAKKNLRDVLFNLRHLIGPFLLVTRQMAGLNPQAPVAIDSRSLRQTLQEVHGSRMIPAPLDGLQPLAEAASQHDGEFLSGFYVPDAPLFEEWMLVERERLHLELGTALEKLTQYALAAGDYTAAEKYARRQLELDSYREIAHRQLMTALALSDRRAEAVAHYEALAALLQSELAIAPAHATRELMAKIRAGETIPLPFAGRRTAPTSNLPVQLTSFVGRKRELAEIKALLEKTRLLTLTGAGGSGKTRLAIQAASQTAHTYADGVTFVSLASVSSLRQVAGAIARELNVLEHPHQPLDTTLQRYLAGKHKLLVLDNFEHLLPAAPLVTDLLRAAPQLTVLVTSREGLHLYGEQEYLVPPLALPHATTGRSLSALMSVDAIDLFVQRARMVRHDFLFTENNAAAVVEICQRLDGLPLAIELAAARIRLFSPHDLLTKLEDRLELLVDGPRDMPQRQRTLRATIAWSFNLLAPEEQQLLAQLAVFSGGCASAAIRAVCSCTATGLPVHGLDSLLSKNLLLQKPGPDGERRFYMLETIHEYGREQLQESGQAEQIRDCHLDYYLHLVEEMAPGYMRQGQLALFKRTDVEMDNIRAALEWAIESKQIEKAARLMAALIYYHCYQTEHTVEGHRLNLRLLPDAERISPQHRVPFLINAAELAFQNNDLALFRQLSAEAIYLARKIGDNRLVAWSLAHSIDYAGNKAADEQAVRNGEEALAIFKELDDKAGVAYTLNRLGEIYRLCGDLKEAKKVYEASLEICCETGEVIREEMLTLDLGLVAYGEGEYGRAKDLLLSAIQQQQTLHSKHAAVTDFVLLCGVIARLGEPQKAAQILGACDRLRSELGMDYHPYDQSMVDRSTADTRALLDEATFAKAWAQGQRMTYEQLQAYVLT